MISVVIPTYNRCESLRRCLISLKSQTLKNFEVVVVDDGSADDTKGVFDSVKDGRFRYIRQVNGGQSAARNLGVRNAAGSIIAFTDDDCEVDQNWLQVIESSLSGEVGCVKGRTEVLNTNNFTGLLRKHIYNSSSAATNNIAYDKNAIMSVGLFDETMRLHEDLDLLWRFRLAGGKRVYEKDMVVFHEFERDMDEFKKVAYNRGKGLRSFFIKYLKIKPTVAFAYLAVAFIPLLVVPVTKGSYMKSLRSFYMLRGFFSRYEIFKVH